MVNLLPGAYATKGRRICPCTPSNGTDLNCRCNCGCIFSPPRPFNLIPLYRRFARFPTLRSRIAHGGTSGGQVRIETSWPLSKSLGRFWTRVSRPKVNGCRCYSTTQGDPTRRCNAPACRPSRNKKTENLIARHRAMIHVAALSRLDRLSSPTSSPSTMKSASRGRERLRKIRLNLSQFGAEIFSARGLIY